MKSRGEAQFRRFPRFAADLYSRLARTSSLHKQYQEIAACLSNWITYGRLLDVGTGPGRLLVEVHKLMPDMQLYGLDISQAMIELAGKNLAGVTADLRAANVSATGYQSNFFDAVICSGSFYLWDQPDKGLDEIYRILKPGCSAHLFETRRDYDQAAFRDALKTNLMGERLAMRLFGPLLLAKALQMAYRTDEAAEVIGRTRFAAGYRIENLSLVGLPIWMHIQLTKDAPC